MDFESISVIKSATSKNKIPSRNLGFLDRIYYRDSNKLPLVTSYQIPTFNKDVSYIISLIGDGFPSWLYATVKRSGPEQ